MSYKYEDFRHDYNEDEDWFGYDDELAFVHTLDGAFAGNTEYMRVLADIYSSDMHGVKRDYNKVIFWLYKLAERGDVYATIRLAGMYFEYDDKGVPHDYRKALMLYEIAAKSGDERAVARLGIMYLYGFGCEKDSSLARELLKRAAGKDEPEASYYYWRILKAEGAKDRFDYLKKAADKSNGKACWEIVSNYADTIPDNKFLMYLACAANYYSFDYDPMQAQLMFADCFMFGYRVKKSATNAKSYYKMAAESGSLEAKEKLKKYFK